MKSVLRAGLLAVLVIAGISFNASAAAPTANANLEVNVNVSVPRVIRVMWGTGSTAINGATPPSAVGGTTDAVVWTIGPQDFDATVTLNAGQPPVLPAYTLSIKNAGTVKVNVGATIVGGDTGAGTQNWTVADATDVDVCSIAVNTTQLDGTSKQIAADLKRSDVALPINITFVTPTDSDFLTGDTGEHAFLIRFTATAP